MSAGAGGQRNLPQPPCIAPTKLATHDGLVVNKQLSHTHGLTKIVGEVVGKIVDTIVGGIVEKMVGKTVGSVLGGVVKKSVGKIVGNT